MYFFAYFALYILSIPVKLAVCTVENKKYYGSNTFKIVNLHSCLIRVQKSSCQLQTTQTEQLHENFPHAIACQIIVKNEASLSEYSININCLLYEKTGFKSKEINDQRGRGKGF